MSDSIPEHLRCDALFLLIGTNTLPNWVATRLLVRTGGTAHLFYTSGVRKHAGRLKEILEEHLHVEMIATADADERKIFADVRHHGTGLKQSKVGVIGLNYTGGTKMMSVHAHRAMHDLGLTDSLSYVDARTLQMKFDYPNGGAYDVSLDPRIRIEVNTLLKLHDDYPDRKNIFYEARAKSFCAAAGLIEVHSKYSGQQVWRRWCDSLEVGKLNFPRMMKENPAEYERHRLKLNAVTLPKEQEFSSRVADHLRQQAHHPNPKRRISSSDGPRFLKRIVDGYSQALIGLKAQGGDELLTVAGKNPGEFTDSVELAKWLVGMWLEHYVFAQLQSVASECNINQDGMAINLETVNSEGRRFEADVIALRGYQLFYLSCYTGNEDNKSKQKLFEALERASQLGGDESKVGLVCNIDTPQRLRKQCEADWERFSCNQIEVFGREDLPGLAAGLKKWLTGESRKNR